MYQCLIRAIPSRKYSIKAPAKWRNALYVLTEICHQRSTHYFLHYFSILIHCVMCWKWNEKKSFHIFEKKQNWFHISAFRCKTVTLWIHICLKKYICTNFLHGGTTFYTEIFTRKFELWSFFKIFYTDVRESKRFNSSFSTSHSSSVTWLNDWPKGGAFFWCSPILVYPQII